MPRRKPAIDAPTRYAQDVVRGRVVAGPYVRLACKRHLADLRDGRKRGLRYDAAAADRAVRFFGFLRHSKGKWGGQAFELSPWQVFIIGSLFGWKRADGRRRFRVAYIEIARKNGKSTLLAGIGLLLLAADGEPGAEVYAAATKLDQARLVHAEARRMVRSSPALKKRLYVGKDNINVPGTASKFEPISGAPETADGYSVHGAIVDEFHAHQTRDMWDVLDTGTGAREQPLLVAITTAGGNQAGPCYDERKYCIGILEGAAAGHVVDDAEFAYIATLDEKDDWQNKPACWIKANPNLGVSVSIEDLTRKVEKCRRQPAAAVGVKQKHFNIWTSGDDPGIDLADWRRCPRVVRRWTEDLAGESCWAGLDLASTQDLNALALVFRRQFAAGPGYVVRCRYWCPAETIKAHAGQKSPYERWAHEGRIRTTPGARTDYAAIRAQLNELREVFDIRSVSIDKWNAGQLINWLHDDGFEIIEVPQSMQRLGAGSRELERAIACRVIDHGNCPVLSWMAGNLVWEFNAEGAFKPSRKKSKNKIDGMMATVMGISQAMVEEESAGIIMVK